MSNGIFMVVLFVVMGLCGYFLGRKSEAIKNLKHIFIKQKQAKRNYEKTMRSSSADARDFLRNKKKQSK